MTIKPYLQIASLFTLMSLAPLISQASDQDLDEKNSQSLLSKTEKHPPISTLKTKDISSSPSLEAFKPTFINTYLKSEKYNSGMYAKMPEHVKKSRVVKAWQQLNRNLVAGNIAGISNDLEDIVPKIVEVVLANKKGLHSRSIKYFSSLKRIAELDGSIADGRKRIERLDRLNSAIDRLNSALD